MGTVGEVQGPLASAEALMRGAARTGMLRESDVALKGVLVWVTVGFAGTWIAVAVRRRRRLCAAIAQPPALVGRPQGPFA